VRAFSFPRFSSYLNCLKKKLADQAGTKHHPYQRDASIGAVQGVLSGVCEQTEINWLHRELLG